MPNRYTIEELEKFSDYEMLHAIVRDREESITNVYSPLSGRLQQLSKKLDHIKPLTKPKSGTFLYPGMLEQIKRMRG